MKNNSIVVPLFFGVLCLVAFSFHGCGKKGPPIAPEIKGYKIAAPYNLKYIANNQEITLSWQHKIDKENAIIKPEAYEVFMAQKTFEDCDGCPFKFQLKELVSMPYMTCSIKLNKGYKYYFRVRAIDDDNMKSEYSKTVQFEYK